MGRPRADGGPLAPERLETAFFDLLRTTDYRDISVSAVVRAAGLNRNSFYYHYTDLDDLARSAADAVLLTEVAHLIAGGLTPDSPQVDRLVVQGIASDRVARILILLGPHSTAPLRGIVRSAVQDVWLAEFGLEHTDLEEAESATLGFVLGGFMATVARLSPGERTGEDNSGGSGRAAGAHDLIERIRELRALPIVEECARILMRTLRAAADRKQGGAS